MRGSRPGAGPARRGLARRGLALAGLALLLAGALPAAPQTTPQTAPQTDRAGAETLADIRQDLTLVFGQVQQLRRELSTTGAPGAMTGGAIVPDSVLDRMSALEQELARLTALVEQAQFRVDVVVADASNRIGDLEFRLCELEPGCDIGALGDLPALGGRTVPLLPPVPAAGADPGPELAVGERAALDRAEAALSAGRPAEAAELFARHAETYPGSPLTAQAAYGRGRALAQLGRQAEAARAWLDAFSMAPDGPVAAAALLELGLALHGLNQPVEACVTLGEVIARFPDRAEARSAATARQTQGCS